MLGEQTSAIRFWDKEFDILKPKKNKKGNRLFTKEDIDNFHIIFHLVKERGMKAMGPLMGVIMGKARGKASPQQVNKLLNAAIRAIIE